MSVQGRVVWHDLNTNDLDGARRFYGELFGWNIQIEGEWALMYQGDDPSQHFGAALKIEPSRPMPPCWVPYIAVERIDDTLAKLPALGGKAFMPKMPAGKTGVFAYAGDPQGAVFSLWQYTEGEPKPEHDPSAPPLVHRFVWDELLTSDTAAAEKFYTSLIGYKADHMATAGLDYTVWQREARRPDGAPRGGGGMMKMPPGVPHPFWLAYVSVADCNRSAEQARRLGATITSPPMDIPTVGRIATLLDPGGAPIALIAPTP